jgi:small subunit ribosomal protein S16
MVKIRLRRTGAKKQPSYRVVVADSDSPRDGRFIEIIGNYNPRTEPITLNLQEDRAFHWLSVGAQMTETVQRLFKNAGTLERWASLKAGVNTQQ